jgi:hypothetical protein
MLSSAPITLDVPSPPVTSSDSLALVALYNQCNGPNWTKKSNWLTGKVETWEGVTVEDGKVVGLNLADGTTSVGVTGSLPAELGGLASLRELYLFNNQISGLPDFSLLTELDDLWVGTNHLDFGDIEPNLGIAHASFTYSPQAAVGVAKTICKTEGDAMRISVTTSGQHNVYQWYHDGELITGESSAVFDIPSVMPADAGVYTCQITNTAATGLILTSEPVTMNVNIGSNWLDITVFLEGAYPADTGVMASPLNTGSTVLPLLQPFNCEPWNYPGGENAASIPDGVVDWILVELRDANSPAEAISGTAVPGWPRAFFLKTNGHIVDLDGISVPNICDPVVTHRIYMVVYHRNHLAVISAFEPLWNDRVFSYDFTTGPDKVYGGDAGYKPAGSKWVMVAGDIDQDGSIYVLDYNRWAAGFGATAGYFAPDLDMDHNVYVSDYNKWAANFGSVAGGSAGSYPKKPKYISFVPK